MDEGFSLKDSVLWLLGAVTVLLGMMWRKQEGDIQDIDRRLGEHEAQDDSKFGECGNHRSAEIGALYRQIDSKTEALGKKIDENHRELNGHIIEILKQVGGAK